MPIYDVTLRRRENAASAPNIKIPRVSAVNAQDAGTKAIELAVKNHADWADATAANTDAMPVARN